MSRITETFSELEYENEGALIAYLTVGYPRPSYTQRLVEALIKGGADMVELGIPFSDPIADGPTIQKAITTSLANGARPLDALKAATQIHEKYDTPLVLMTYFNPVYRIGLPTFLRRAKKSGVSGLIIPDLPAEESEEYKKECLAAGIDTIFLASPSTQPDRLKRILRQTSGYLYLISLYGVTGIRSTITAPELDLVKRYATILKDTVPLAVGFGISGPDHVKQIIRAGAGGAIVGSAFIQTIERSSGAISQKARRLERLARAMKNATIGTRR